MSPKNTDVPDDLQAFIEKKIDSVETLETLLLLRNESNRSWYASEISLQLRSHPDSVAARLVHLVQGGLVHETVEEDRTCYRYYPRSPDLDGFVTELSRAYLIRRYSVINMIYANAKDPIQKLANAFVVRKDSGNA